MYFADLESGVWETAWNATTTAYPASLAFTRQACDYWIANDPKRRGELGECGLRADHLCSELNPNRANAVASGPSLLRIEDVAVRFGGARDVLAPL